MPDSKAVQLVIKSGMIPEEMLQQLVAWKLLPESAAEQAGSQPVSLEHGWRTVEEFVDTLGQAIDKESVQIKETRLASNKRFERIHMMFDNDDDGYMTLAIVESEDCVAVPATGKRNPREIVIRNVKREVWKIEERFQGDELTTLVCHLKPVPQEEA